MAFSPIFEPYQELVIWFHHYRHQRCSFDPFIICNFGFLIVWFSWVSLFSSVALIPCWLGRVTFYCVSGKLLSSFYCAVVSFTYFWMPSLLSASGTSLEWIFCSIVPSDLRFDSILVRGEHFPSFSEKWKILSYICNVWHADTRYGRTTSFSYSKIDSSFPVLLLCNWFVVFPLILSFLPVNLIIF